MTSSEEHKRGRSADEVVVAAYAGPESGLTAFAGALSDLRDALPQAEVWALVPRARPSLRNAPALTAAAGVIEYPTPPDLAGSGRASGAAADAVDAHDVGRAVARVVAALARLRAAAAVVLAARGHAPYTPAYLCYLAGIRHRAGFESEFAGGVLSRADPQPPLQEDSARFIALLAAGRLDEVLGVTSGRQRDQRSTIRSQRCAG